MSEKRDEIAEKAQLTLELFGYWSEHLRNLKSCVKEIPTSDLARITKQLTLLVERREKAEQERLEAQAKRREEEYALVAQAKEVLEQAGLKPDQINLIARRMTKEANLKTYVRFEVNGKVEYTPLNGKSSAKLAAYLKETKKVKTDLPRFYKTEDDEYLPVV